MDNATSKKLAQIAREQIPGLEGRPDLDPRHNDAEDFIELSVWSLEAALAAAYELGKKDAEMTNDEPQPACWEWYAETHHYGVDGTEEEFGYRCSNCKMYASEWGADDDIYEEPPTHLHYCPNCGKKLINEEETR